MADYRVQLCSALDDSVLAELTAATINFGEVLNGPGSATVTAALDQTASAITSIDPLLTSLFIIRDNVPVFGGIVWATQMDVRANSVSIMVAGFWSLVRRRRIRTSAQYVATDQALIAKDIIDDLQAVPGGDMLIDTSAVTAVGKTRDRTYYHYERKNAGEAIEQLADVRGGFDFAIRPIYDSGVLKRRFTVSYPNTGRTTNIVLDADSNVELLSASVDATTMVTTMHTKGEGEGNEALLITKSNAPLLGVYPLVEDLAVFSDVKEYWTLDAHAQRALDLGQTPMVLPTVVVAGDASPRIGSYVVGDQVRLRAQYGLLDIDRTFRITAWTAAVETSGREAVTLTLAPLEVFSNA